MNYCGASGACSSSANPSTAGAKCAAGQTCFNGACLTVCSGSQIVCGGACVDPTTNNGYCGASGNCSGTAVGVACAGGQNCTGSKCACPAALPSTCSGTCTNTKSDPNNCGSCGTKCSGSTPQCVSGVCTKACTSFAFTETAYSTPAENPIWLAIGDVNNDGYMDIVYVDQGSTSNSNLGVLVGSSGGTFTLLTPTSIDPQSGRIALGDLSGDHNLDAAVTNYTTNAGEGIVFLGTGSGTWGSPIHLYTDLLMLGVAVADINKDGRPDIIMAAQNAGVVIYENMGNGVFQAMLPVLQPGFLPYDVAVADMNGDGIPDIVVGGSYNSQGAVTIIQGTGGGLFAPAAAVTLTPAAVAVAATTTFVSTIVNKLVVTDLNGDGYPDVVTADTGYASVSVLKNVSGTLTAGAVYKLNPVPSYANAAALAAGDFNGDGKMDIAVTNYYSGAGGPLLQVFPGNGNYTLGTVYNVTLGSGDVPYGIAVADMNGDGKPDIVTANSYGDTVSVFKNTCQ